MNINDFRKIIYLIYISMKISQKKRSSEFYKVNAWDKFNVFKYIKIYIILLKYFNKYYK